jgi:hypothetical protein
MQHAAYTHACVIDKAPVAGLMPLCRGYVATTTWLPTVYGKRVCNALSAETVCVLSCLLQPARGYTPRVTWVKARRALRSRHTQYSRQTWRAQAQLRWQHCCYAPFMFAKDVNCTPGRASVAGRRITCIHRLL